jgi:hypothetical protein
MTSTEFCTRVDTHSTLPYKGGVKVDVVSGRGRGAVMERIRAEAVPL